MVDLLSFLFFQAAPPVQHVFEPSAIVDFFQKGSQQWEPLMSQVANWMFYTLASIDCVWMFISKVGETHDAKDAWNHVMPRMIGLLFWFNLVRLGIPFLIAIPLSFLKLGQMASTAQAMTPSGILADGFNVAGTLMHNAYASGNLMTIVTGMFFGLPAILIIAAYFVVALHLALALIEMWTSLRAAFLFLGFAGSSWTRSYAERYITLLMATGVRLMILELFVGFGHQFTTQWFQPAVEKAPFDDTGIMVCFQVAACAMLYAMVCWNAPQKIAGVLSGSPALSAGHITGFVMPAMSMAIGGAQNIYGGITGAVGQGVRAVFSTASSAMRGAMGGSDTPQPQPKAASASAGLASPPQPKPRRA
jgi:type IV secretion system protein TrbL